MMLATALFGVLMGVIVGVRANRARQHFLALSNQFAALEASARADEEHYSSDAEWHKSRMAESAQRAAFAMKELRGANGLSTGGRFGDRDLDAIADLMQLELTQAIESGTLHCQQAAEDRTCGELAAKKARYFSQLKQKYEHAAAHAWAVLEPEAPVGE
jgi:hypothetical protein